MDSDDEMRHPIPEGPSPAFAARDAAREPYTLLDVKSGFPIPLKFTWARQAVVPCKFGVRKDVFLLKDLIRFRAKADIMIPSGRFIYGFSVKDTILNGRFSVNVPGRIVAYQKKLQLPNGANIALSAGTQYIGGHGLSLGSKFKPICGVQLRFGSVGDGNIVASGDGFQLKQRVPIPLGLLGLPDYPKFDLETFTSVRIPQLTTRYSVQNDGFSFGSPMSALEESAGMAGRQRDRDALHVHVQGINVVVRL